MQNRNKFLKILLPALAAIIIIAVAALFIGNQSAGEGKVVGGGAVRPVAYDNAIKPAPGTQLFDMEIKNEKLTKGPSEIHSVVGGAFKINVTAYTSAPEYEFFVEHYTDNAEIDAPLEGQHNVLTGQVYILTDTKGTFKYGVEDESAHKKITLGTLYVQ